MGEASAMRYIRMIHGGSFTTLTPATASNNNCYYNISSLPSSVSHLAESTRSGKWTPAGERTTLYYTVIIVQWLALCVYSHLVVYKVLNTCLYSSLTCCRMWSKFASSHLALLVVSCLALGERERKIVLVYTTLTFPSCCTFLQFYQCNNNVTFYISANFHLYSLQFLMWCLFVFRSAGSRRE